MKPRLLSLVLAVALLDPLGLLARTRHASEHECTDHVCACARSAQKQCHESEDAPAGIQAACNHDSPGALGSLTPAVLELETSLEVSAGAERSRPAPRQGPLLGFLRIDSPPPRNL